MTPQCVTHSTHTASLRARSCGGSETPRDAQGVNELLALQVERSAYGEVLSLLIGFYLLLLT